MRSRFAMFAGIVALSAWAIGISAQGHDHAAGQDHDHAQAQDHDHAAGQDHDHAQAGQHEAGAHTHPEAAKLKNPVKATPESIASGKKIYDAQCTSCHGETGKGDGKMAASITGEKPADLSDATVVTLYLSPEINLRLRPKLLRELRPGARIVSHVFDMGDWAPARTIRVDTRDRPALVFLWIVPPRP